jgi:hypothetical protein
VGGGIAAAGLGLGYIAAESMAGWCRQPGEPKEGCRSPSDGTPIVGACVLGIVFVGGLVAVTGVEHPEPPPAVSVAPPPVEPVALDQADAVAMATAQLALMVSRGKAPLARLQGVDDHESSLRVEERRAELSGLRVRIGSDRRWQTVGACYEFDTEWRVTWLGANPRCWRPR